MQRHLIAIFWAGLLIGTDKGMPQNIALPAGTIEGKNSPERAFRVTGQLKVTEFSLEGKPSSNAAPIQFDVRVSGNRWEITSTFKKDYYLAYGFDGTNIHSYLEQKEYRQAKHVNYSPASVFEEDYPIDTTYYVTLPWLAYASEHYIKRHSTNGIVKIPAVWAIPMDDPVALIFHSHPEISTARPKVPMSLEFMPDIDEIERVKRGELTSFRRPGKPLADLVQLQILTYDPAMPAATYQVLSTTQFDGLVLPSEFILTRYWVSKNTNDTFRGKPMSLFRGILEKAELIDHVSGIPQCDHILAVGDYRFAGRAPLVEFIPYMVTNNQWPAKNDPRLERIFQQEKAKIPAKRFSQPTVMLFLLVFFSVPAIVWIRARLRKPEANRA